MGGERHKFSVAVAAVNIHRAQRQPLRTTLREALKTEDFVLPKAANLQVMG